MGIAPVLPEHGRSVVRFRHEVKVAGRFPHPNCANTVLKSIEPGPAVDITGSGLSRTTFDGWIPMELSLVSAAQLAAECPWSLLSGWLFALALSLFALMT